MNIVYIVLAIIAFFLIAGIGIFLFFTRIGRNLLTQIVFNKKYVICHVVNENTDFEEIWKVVPKKDSLTKVNKFDYDLNPRYALLRWKGRLHFRINDKDVIPQYVGRTDSNEEILIQVQEIRTALHNNAYDWLYAKKQNIALILCGVALFISLLVAVYAVYKIGQISPMIEWLYAHPPASESVVTTVTTGK